MGLTRQTTVNALNTANRAGRFAPNTALVDQLLRKFIFQALDQTELFEFCRATALPTPAFFARDTALTSLPTEVSLTSFGFGRLGGRAGVDRQNQVGSRGTDQLQEQILGLKLGILNTLSANLIHKTAGYPLRSFEELVAGGEGVLLTASNPLDLQDLYKARFSCKPSDGWIGGLGGTYFVGHEKALRQVLYLLNQAGKPTTWTFDPELGVKLLKLCGIYFLIDNSVPITAGSPETTSIYVVQLRGRTSLKMLYVRDSEDDCDGWGINTYWLPVTSTKENLYAGVGGYFWMLVPETRLIVRLQTVRLSNIL